MTNGITVIGKYYFQVLNNDGTIHSKSEASNIVVNNGLSQIVNWLISNAFTTNYYPGLKKIDTTGMTITNANFSNPSNVVDWDSETYASATINNTNWNNIWWKIDLGTSKNIMALYVDFCQGDTNYGCDYKFQYSSDDVNWYDFDVRFRPAQESLVRSKVLFYLNVTPPFLPVSGVRYIRLNTRQVGTAQAFRFHELRLYEDNFFSQPPMIMGLGTSLTNPSASDTSITNGFYKKVSNITKPSSNVARFIMDIDTSEANDVNYWEVGMFFNGNNNYSLQTTSNATTMFSRAIFNEVLNKTSGQTAQIVYELTVNNT